MLSEILTHLQDGDDEAEDVPPVGDLPRKVVLGQVSCGHLK